MDGVGIEKFAEWCHAAADNFVGVVTQMRCRCSKVEVFEHENNSAIYEIEHESTNKTQTTDTTAAVVNTNSNKTTNKWVDDKSTNVWGI